MHGLKFVAKRVTAAHFKLADLLFHMDKYNLTINPLASGTPDARLNLRGLAVITFFCGSSVASATSYNDGFIQVTEGAYGTGAAHALGANNLAIGAGAQAIGLSATGIGSSSKANGENATALGVLAEALSFGSSAFGVASRALGRYSTALGAQSAARGEWSVAVGEYAQAYGDGAVVLGGGAVADSGWSVAVGGSARASGSNSLALGSDARATHNHSVALGAGSHTSDSIGTSETVIAGKSYAFAGASPVGVVSFGADFDETGSVVRRQLTNVAAGRLSSVSTDAVNGSQLHATNTALESVNALANQNDAGLLDLRAKLDGGSIGLVIQDTQTSAISVGKATGGVSLDFGGTEGNRTLTGVKAGSLKIDSADAVNGSQLFQVVSRVDGIGDRVGTLENGLSGIARGGGIKFFHANSTKADSLAIGSDSVAAGPNAEASGSSATAIGDSAMASGSQGVAIGVGALAAAANSVALGANSISNRENTVSVGAAGQERQIINVAAGSAQTDAVNVAQLDAVKTSMGAVAGSLQVNNVAIEELRNGRDGMIKVENDGVVAQMPIASGRNAIAAGKGAVSSGADSTALGNAATARANNAVAIGNSAEARAENSVALGAGTIADQPNSVSVGRAGAERRIMHVAPAISNSDVVNLGQMNKGLEEANRFTRKVYGMLHQDIKQLDEKLSAGVAGAMAMAALPQPYSPGASMTAAGLSGYRGQSALAVGMSHISDNGRWVSKLQGNTNSQGGVGVSVGVGYQW